MQEKDSQYILSHQHHYFYEIGKQIWINRLKEFTNSGSIPRYSILKKQGYRVVNVEKHLIFYRVNEENKTVIVYAIVDGRREYQKYLEM